MLAMALFWSQQITLGIDPPRACETFWAQRAGSLPARSRNAPKETVMKRSAPHHQKMYDLAKRLGMPIYAAVGIMEMLWHFSGQNTPEGDIGRVSDVQIAGAIGWDRKPDVLIKALVASTFLDRHPDYRLIVHNWPKHCEQTVRKTLLNRGSHFLPIYSSYSVAVQPSEDVKFPENIRNKSGTISTEKAPSGAAEAKAEAFGEFVVSGKTTNPEVSPRETALSLEKSTVGTVFLELKSIYQQAGKPISSKHEHLAIQLLLGIPEDRLPRVPNYVKWALVSGTWSDVAHTKSLLNVLRDGDWDVELTARSLPNTTDNRVKKAQDEARRQFMEGV